MFSRAVATAKPSHCNFACVTQIMGVAGVLSCTLVSGLLFYIILFVVFEWSYPRPSNYYIQRDRPALLTSKQIACVPYLTLTPAMKTFTRFTYSVFITCLFVSDLIQSISGVSQVKWAYEGRIYAGPHCTLQGNT